MSEEQTALDRESTRKTEIAEGNEWHLNANWSECGCCYMLMFVVGTNVC